MSFPEFWLRDNLADVTGSKAFPVMCTDDTVQPPFSVYSRIATDRERVTDAPSGYTGAVDALFEVNIVTSTYMQGKELVETLRQKITNFRGDYEGCYITWATIADQQDAAPEEKDGESQPDYVQQMTIRIRYREN